MSEEFGAAMAAAYKVEGAAIDLGRGVHDGQVVPEAAVRIPLKMMNRHFWSRAQPERARRRRFRASPSSSRLRASRCS